MKLVSIPANPVPDDAPSASTAAPAPAPEAVHQTIDWLHAAERPAILAGGGAWLYSPETMT